LFFCDIQERFRELIVGMQTVVNNSKLLLSAAKVFGMQTVYTLQYPKVFGATVAELQVNPSDFPENKRPIEMTKHRFSMVIPGLLERLPTEIKTIVIVGIEAHICVLQTCYDLIAKGYRVYLVVDAVSSMRAHDRAVAIRHLASMGARLTTAESILYQMMGSGKNQHFRAITNLAKKHPHEKNFPFTHSNL